MFYVYFFPLFMKQWYMYLYITEVLLYPITRHVTHCTDLCVTKNYESVQIATTVQLQLTWRPIINSFLTKFFINRITYCYIFFIVLSVHIFTHADIQLPDRLHDLTVCPILRACEVNSVMLILYWNNIWIYICKSMIFLYCLKLKLKSTKV